MYEDILYLPHHTSPSRPPMPMSDRAAQFSPFAALTGYEAAVKEAARREAEDQACRLRSQAEERMTNAVEQAAGLLLS